MTADVRRTADVDSALAIARALPGSFTESGVEEMRRTLPEAHLYGAYDGDRMTGFASFRRAGEGAVELEWLAVLPDTHGGGIGGRLVAAGLTDLAGSAALCYVKTLAPTNPYPEYARTRRFYTHLGFVPVEIIDPYPGWEPGNPCLIMVKCLLPHPGAQ